MSAMDTCIGCGAWVSGDVRADTLCAACRLSPQQQVRYRAALEKIAGSSGRLGSYEGYPCPECVELISMADDARWPEGK